MKPNEIRAAFWLAERSIKSLADELGVKPPAIHQVINGERNNPRIRQAIAEKIVGKPVSEIWPDAKPEEAAA